MAGGHDVGSAGTSRQRRQVTGVTGTSQRHPITTKVVLGSSGAAATAVARQWQRWWWRLKLLRLTSGGQQRSGRTVERRRSRLELHNPRKTIFSKFDGSDTMLKRLLCAAFASSSQPLRNGRLFMPCSRSGSSNMQHPRLAITQQSRLPSMKSDGNLKEKAYKAIKQKMMEKFGSKFTTEKIKNKLKSTKAYHNICEQILATSRFGWNPTNKCVDVDNEVWAFYIQLHYISKQANMP
ncbi:hypothetical protein EJ110_NYTH20337 [Nymphaea thermarum]|nr:hypothetical protein EJ110_NYTH20337 [Nymphaea thermarum]